MDDTTTWTTHIDALPAAVFELLADLRNHSQWSQKAYTATKTSEGPIRVGTTYDTRAWMPGKSDEYLNHVTITGYEPGRRLAFDAVDPDGVIVPSDWVLSDEEGGTRAVRTSTMPRPSGFQGFMWPIIFPALVKPAIGKNLQMFKAVVESKSGEMPDS